MQLTVATILTKLFTKHLYTLAIGGSVLVFAAAHQFGWSPEGLVIGWGVLVLAGAVMLERVIPFERSWREPRGDTGVDTTSALLLVGVIAPRYVIFPEPNLFYLFPCLPR